MKTKLSKVYFSVEPEGADESSLEGPKRLMHFLQGQGYLVYRAPYVFAADKEAYIRGQMKLDRQPTLAEHRELHMRWIDDADLLLADVSNVSEGMFMIIQRALDKTLIGLPYTPIILIRDKNKERRFGKIVRAVLDSVIYYEYHSIDDVIKEWDKLIEKANSMRR